MTMTMPETPTDSYEKALRAYNQGNLTNAYRHIKKHLVLNKSAHEAWHFKGIIELQQDKSQKALLSLKEAVSIDNNNPEYWNNLGIAAKRQQELETASQAFQHALSLDKTNLKYIRNLADLCYEAGKYRESSELYGIIYTQTKVDNEVNHHYVNSLIEVNKYTDALSILDALKDTPSMNDNLRLLHGIAYRYNNQNEQAITVFQSLYTKNPNSSVLELELMVAYLNIGAHQTAKEYALKLQSQTFDNPMSYHAVAKVLLETGNYQSAELLFNKALAFESNDKALYVNAIHNSLYAKNNPLSFELLQKAMRIFPNSIDMLSLAYQFEANHLNWANAAKIREALLEIVTKHPEPASISHYIALHIADDYSGLKQFTEINNKFEYPHKPARMATVTYQPKRKIHIGYISPDFRNHCVGLLLGNLFKLHDRDKFKIYAYDTTNCKDEYQDTIRHSVDVWCEADSLSNQALAEKIVSDEIDILVDLAGLTKSARQYALAMKPAPIVCHYLGDFGTLATDYHDFYLTHAENVPEEAKPSFTENLCFLPMPHVITSYPNESYTPTRQDFNLPENGTVLCCFNNTLRINEPTVRSWFSILDKTTDQNTILWLYDLGQQAKKNLFTLADQYEIAHDRLHFLDKVYLTEKWPMKVADLYLDTFYLTGFTSVLLSASCGLPALTSYLPGIMSRESSILNKLLGFENELVALSENEYIAKAITLIQNPNTLLTLKTSLASQKTNQQGLFNQQSFIGSLENAYLSMINQLQTGNGFSDIEIN